MEQHVYLAIDAKAFFASVECVARGLDPLTTNLVVADESRTEKTICLAVSPALKAYSISGRARLFEVVQKVREVNALRRSRAPGRNLTGESCDAWELASSPSPAVSYIVAPPRMARYIKCSSTIYQIYLKYVAPKISCPYLPSAGSVFPSTFYNFRPSKNSPISTWKISLNASRFSNLQTVRQSAYDSGSSPRMWG